MARFAATHEITDKRGDKTLVRFYQEGLRSKAGGLYSKQEWDGCEAADRSLSHEGELLFQGSASHSEVDGSSIRRLDDTSRPPIPFKSAARALRLARAVSTDPKVLEEGEGFVARGDDLIDSAGNRSHVVYGRRGTFQVRR